MKAQIIFHTYSYSKYDGTKTVTEVANIIHDDDADAMIIDNLWGHLQDEGYGEGEEIFLYTDNPCVYGDATPEIDFFGHKLTREILQSAVYAPEDKYATGHQIFRLTIDIDENGEPIRPHARAERLQEALLAKVHLMIGAGWPDNCHVIDPVDGRSYLIQRYNNRDLTILIPAEDGESEAEVLRFALRLDRLDKKA